MKTILLLTVSFTALATAPALAADLAALRVVLRLDIAVPLFRAASGLALSDRRVHLHVLPVVRAAGPPRPAAGSPWSGA